MRKRERTEDTYRKEVETDIVVVLLARHQIPRAILGPCLLITLYHFIGQKSCHYGQRGPDSYLNTLYAHGYIVKQELPHFFHASRRLQVIRIQ